MKVPSLSDIELNDKRVLCRVDFNVPLTDDGAVSDNTRIRAALPTLQHVLDAGGKLICASHLGRPKGKVVDRLRMVAVGAELAKLLGEKHRVLVADETVGDGARKLAAELKSGDVLLLENTRFNPGETKNDENLSKALAEMCEVYVNDAFGTAHRAHASTAGVAAFVETKAMGLLMQGEVEALGSLTGDVARPFVAILGGAKVSDKIGVLERLLDKVNVMVIGGAMANTFIAATGGDVGASMIEADQFDTAKRVLTAAKSKGVRICLPEDAVIADSLDAEHGAVAAADAVPEGQMALDIGPKTQAAYAEVLKTAKTVFWNGPMGVFEREPFAAGTMAVAAAVADPNSFSVVGGGDSVAAIQRSGVADKINHISTGGGASLAFLEGKALPGLVALQ